MTHNKRQIQILCKSAAPTHAYATPSQPCNQGLNKQSTVGNSPMIPGRQLNSLVQTWIRSGRNYPDGGCERTIRGIRLNCNKKAAYFDNYAQFSNWERKERFEICAGRHGGIHRGGDEGSTEAVRRSSEGKRNSAPDNMKWCALCDWSGLPAPCHPSQFGDRLRLPPRSRHSDDDSRGNSRPLNGPKAVDNCCAMPIPKAHKPHGELATSAPRMFGAAKSPASRKQGCAAKAFAA